MEVSFSDLKEKEIINLYDGKKLGHIVDILFDNVSGAVQGIVVPGERKIFRKGDDIFVPLDRLRKIGDDVILINLNLVGTYSKNVLNQNRVSQKTSSLMQNYYPNYQTPHNFPNKSQSQSNPDNKQSYLRYKPIARRKYK